MDGFFKSVWCVRVDGVGDEGLGYKEVVFLWVEKYFMENYYFICVIFRYLGGLYLNVVELMNGCFVVVYFNLFILFIFGGVVNIVIGFNEI